MCHIMPGNYVISSLAWSEVVYFIYLNHIIQGYFTTLCPSYEWIGEVIL